MGEGRRRRALVAEEDEEEEEEAGYDEEGDYELLLFEDWEVVELEGVELVFELEEVWWGSYLGGGYWGVYWGHGGVIAVLLAEITGGGGKMDVL